MTLDSTFQWASTAALLGWLLLAAGAVVREGAARRALLLAGGRVLPLLLPCLPLTFWFGTAGLLLYVLLMGLRQAVASARR